MVNMFFLKDVKKTADCGSVFEPKQDEEYLCYDDTIQMPQSPQEGYTDYVNTNSETDTENTESYWSYNEKDQFANSEKTSCYFTQMSPSYSLGVPSKNLGSLRSTSTELIHDDDLKTSIKNEFSSIKPNNSFLDTSRTYEVINRKVGWRK